MESVVTKEKWYRAGLAFDCTQCGGCCSGPPGYVWATKKEIKAIAEFLGREDDRLPKTHLRRVGFRHSLTERANGDCIFLRRDGGKIMCDIYPVRPLQCRTWPFWSSNLTSSDAWNRAGQACPGINRGKPHSFETIENNRKKKAK